MDYKLFCKLNERSKRINQSKRMIYIKSVKMENKKYCLEMLDYDIDEEWVGLMPEKVYVCKYEKSLSYGLF